LAPRKDYFVALCEAIVSQQLSTKAAATIYRRFRELFPRKRPTPEVVLTLTDEQLRSVGLSNQKLGYMRDLARKFADGTVPRRGIARMTDEEIIAALTQVKGVGVWTAQMFLIFVLGRPDVWPTDDLGIRRAVQINFGYDEMPLNGELIKVAEPWRPFRSVASWYLWRSLNNKPMR
jgi:DNA-3-methyladenine glycosylase II